MKAGSLVIWHGIKVCGKDRWADIGSQVYNAVNHLCGLEDNKDLFESLKAPAHTQLRQYFYINN